MTIAYFIKAINLIKTLLAFRLNSIRHGRLPYCSGATPIIFNKGEITVGDDLRIRTSQLRVELTCFDGAELLIGNKVFINSGASICAYKSITIGDNTLIGDNASIDDSSYHEVEEGQGIKIEKINIGTNVWIGRYVSIMPGVTIGDNSVIGTNSVVIGSIPPNCIAAGSPARVIREMNNSKSFVRK